MGADGETSRLGFRARCGTLDYVVEIPDVREVGLGDCERAGCGQLRSVSGNNPSWRIVVQKVIARLEPRALRDLGFSVRKATTIIEIARAVVTGILDLGSLERASDTEAVALLTSVRGIGRWSAEYVLLRGLGRLSVFPGDDVGARNNLARRLGSQAPLDYEAVGSAVSRWQPYAGLVYFHLLVERLEATGAITVGESSDPSGK